MSIDPVISLKRNYHKEFKIGGEALCHISLLQKYLQIKTENNPNMLPKENN